MDGDIPMDIVQRYVRLAMETHANTWTPGWYFQCLPGVFVNM
jgi:hypothetical protein